MLSQGMEKKEIINSTYTLRVNEARKKEKNRRISSRRASSNG
jgi:hypothetical protein